MPRNDTLYYVDAKEVRNNFLYAPATKPNTNNFLYTCYGTNGSVAMSDPDALSLATLGNVTVAAERLALDKLALDLKAANLWVKLHALYPFTPGSDSRISYALNLRVPGTHTLTIPADIVCNPSGITNIAATTAQCTSTTLGFNVVDLNNSTIGVFYNNPATLLQSLCDARIVPTTGAQLRLQTRGDGGTLVGEGLAICITASNLLVADQGEPGLHTLRRLNNVATYDVNGTTLTSDVVTASTNPTDGVFSVGTVQPISCAFVAAHLTNAELITLTSIINTYQAALTVSRNYNMTMYVNADTATFAQVSQLQRWRHITIADSLVTGLKTDNIWSSLTALYPFVGGTALAHSINLRSPSQYQITWNGSLTHDSSGTKSDGQTGWGNTNYVQSVVFEYSGIYVTEVNGRQQVTDFGAVNGVVRHSFHYNFSSPNWIVGDIGNFQAAGGRLVVPSDVPTGGLLAQFRQGQNQYLYKNSALIASSTNAADTTASNVTYKLFTDGSASPKSTRKTALCIIAQSLTPAQHTLLYNQIQAFQQALGRSV